MIRLELGEEVLDQMSCLIEMRVIITLINRVTFGWHQDLTIDLMDWVNHPILGIVGFIHEPSPA